MGLNVETWERYLHDCPDKRLLENIKFGYPLSLINSLDLNNIDVSNYVSALQHDSAVSKYISKESAFRAMLGTENKIDNPQYHCSPILMRPKDHNKRRVIPNLSHPKET